MGVGSGSCQAHSLLSPRLPEASGGKDPLSKPGLDTLRSNEGALILGGVEDKTGHHPAELPFGGSFLGVVRKVMSVCGTLETFLSLKRRIPLLETRTLN